MCPLPYVLCVHVACSMARQVATAPKLGTLEGVALTLEAAVKELQQQVGGREVKARLTCVRAHTVQLSEELIVATFVPANSTITAPALLCVHTGQRASSQEQHA